MAEHSTDIKTDHPSWPDPYSRKTEKYMEECIDYAVANHGKRDQDRRKDIALKAKFVGHYKKSALTDLHSTTGTTENKYIDYKLGHRKIMQLMGEWNRRPINATVYTINGQARTEKDDAVKVHMALAATKDETSYLRENNLANPFEGMESQYDMESEDDNEFLKKLNSKETNEHIHQIGLNDYIRYENARDVLYLCYLDNILTSKAFAKTQMQPNGKVTTRYIDVSNAIYHQPIGSFFLDDSMYIGERRKMTYSDIMDSWPELKLSKHKAKLEKVKSLFGNFFSSVHENHSRPDDFDNKEGQDHTYVHTIQWMAYDPIVKKTGKDRYGKLRESVISSKYFNENKSKLMREYRNGKYDLDIRYEKNIYEATRIGDHIYVGLGRIHDQMHNPDDPWDVKYDYTGLLFNTVLGKQTSIQELMINLEHTYNLIRMAINRELGKFKGMIMTYDRAQLPRVNGQAMSFESILNKMYNEGVMHYNSSADGNLAQEGRTQGDFFKQVDLGLTGSMDSLIKLGYEIEDTTNKIIGFNDDRLGDTPASSTVTNAQNNQINSQAATTPLVYFFNRFTEKIMCKYVEKRKISMAYYRKNEANAILGTAAAVILRSDDEFWDDYYGVYITDSQKEEFIRERLIARADVDIQGGMIRNHDVAKAEMAETVQEAIAIMDVGYDQMRSYVTEQREQENKAAQELQQAKGEQVTADREDIQQHEKDLAILEAELEGRKAAAANITTMEKAEIDAESKRYAADNKPTQTK